MDNIHNALDGTKRLDLYETGRVDKQVGIEETMRNFKVLIDEGKFDHIGLSEVSAATIRKAHAVSSEYIFPFRKAECLLRSQIHPVAAVEIEISPWSYEEETKAVIVTAQDLDIPVIAYSFVDSFTTAARFCP